jgi:hypothetical protein
VKLELIPLEAFKEIPYHECGGRLKSLGTGITNSVSSSWPHKCEKCGRIEILNDSYPRLIHKKRRTNE